MFLMRLYFWKQPNKNRERPQLVRCHVHSRFFYFVKSLNLPALNDITVSFNSFHNTLFIHSSSNFSKTAQFHLIDKKHAYILYRFKQFKNTLSIKFKEKT